MKVTDKSHAEYLINHKAENCDDGMSCSDCFIKILYGDCNELSNDLVIGKAKEYLEYEEKEIGEYDNHPCVKCGKESICDNSCEAINETQQ